MTIDELIEIVKKRSLTKTLSVAWPHDPVTLTAARRAYEEEIAKVSLFGDRDIIEKAAQDDAVNIDGFEVFDIKDEQEAVSAAVKAAGEKEAHMLMKGSGTTRVVMSTVLNSKKGIISEGRVLSHAGVFYAPMYKRTMILTDAGINISPNLERKVQIIKNSIEVAHKIGVKKPKIALLAAIETLNITHMPITIEAELIEKMGTAGMFGEAIVEGPFALDNAVDPEAARMKHVPGEVAGRADILVAPDIEAGNILYKSIISFPKLPFANVVVGARVPIVLTSRADSEKTKLASIALASFLSD